MCQSQRHASPWEPKHTHQFIGWVMAHDILPEQVQEFNIIAEEGRLYEDDVAFHGYWEDDAPASTRADDCVVSVHRASDRALLWIVNTSREDRNVPVTVDLKALGLDARRTVALDAETGDFIKLAGSRLDVDVLKRDFRAVHLIERRFLDGEESFHASFDGTPDADQALGCLRLIHAGLRPGTMAALTEGVKGKALAVDGPVAMWPHLNVSDAEGRIRFAARLTGTPGTVFATERPSVRAPLQPPVHGISIDIAGKPLSLTFGRTGAAAPEGVTASVSAPAPGEGWHEFELAWSGGKATLQVDGNAVGEIDIDGMNICRMTGKALLESANFVFGGRRSALDAIDELRCYRR
jgi:hypothetical protein